MQMYLIAGLGNPSKEYEKTRHNMGFECVDVLAEKLGIKVNKSRFRALVGTGTYNGEKVMLAKPQTFMNKSGDAIRPLLKFYRINPEDRLIVIYDDSDLDIGKIRVRKQGSAGSHNGMKHISGQIGNDFMRVRIGIGKRPEHMDMVDYVLSRFGKEDRQQIDEAIDRAADAVLDIMDEGIDKAMNKYN